MKSVLECLKKGLSLDEIVKITNKTECEINAIILALQEEGITICKKFTNEGILSYYLGIDNVIKNELIPTNFTSRFLVISDIHIGVKDDGLDNLMSVLDYAKSNDIHIIFCVGDLIEGEHSNSFKWLNNLDEQINMLVNEYPKESHLLFAYILGNHDIHSLKYDHIDIRTSLFQKSNFIYLGLGSGVVNIAKEVVGFKHDLSIMKTPVLPDNLTLLFEGGTHKYDIRYPRIRVPALACTDKYKDILSSGFLDAKLSFNEKGELTSTNIKHLLFFEGIKQASDIVYLTNKVKKKI